MRCYGLEFITLTSDTHQRCKRDVTMTFTWCISFSQVAEQKSEPYIRILTDWCVRVECKMNGWMMCVCNVHLCPRTLTSPVMKMTQVRTHARKRQNEVKSQTWVEDEKTRQIFTTKGKWYNFLSFLYCSTLFKHFVLHVPSLQRGDVVVHPKNFSFVILNGMWRCYCDGP